MNEHDSEIIDSYSEEIHEVIAQVPSWTIRWGITILFAVVLLALFLCMLIRYPDVILSRVIITTEVSPVNVVANSSGKIEILVKNEQSVNKGDVLAFIESISDKEEIFLLQQEIDRLEESLQGAFSSEIIALNSSLEVGELQNSYTEFLASVQELRTAEKLALPGTRLKSIESKILQYKRLNEHLEKQKVLQKEELEIRSRTFEIDKKLYTEKVIAEVDFNKIQAAYLLNIKDYQASENQMLANDIVIAELTAQLEQIKWEDMQELEQKRNALVNSLRRLEGQIQHWYRQFIITAPMAGRAAILKFTTNNQFVREGTEVIAIVPESQEIYGQLLVPVAGSGKILVGQQVNIKLDNFPYIEYGIVTGRIKEISPIPNENLYTVSVALPYGLRTSFQKTLPFTQQLSGSGEIITRDMSVFDRIFNQVHSILDGSPKITN
ncbi:HlyD family secretion protein [Algoriphagus terrigena]|uniref:HlyD family secretion protein n=1 Tax=Algoriphagus terrigena TaxID=344884 RepID=UPI00041F3DA8|nr:HlyD family efflux transporter periplasmic adaptor subunit [Algoriphagus terrigena]